MGLAIGRWDLGSQAFLKWPQCALGPRSLLVFSRIGKMRCGLIVALGKSAWVEVSRTLLFKFWERVVIIGIWMRS